MRKLRLVTLLWSLITLSSGTFAEQNQFAFWTAYQKGSVMMTNYDIEEYICVTSLSDETRILLFKEAEGDYNRYEGLRRKWAQARFEDGLRQFAYVQAVQDYATDKFEHRQGRQTFKVTERTFYDRIEELESKTLKKWLDDRQGIVKARKFYGSELKKIGYPHKENQTDEELYWDWYELQKKRIKEDFRLKEVPKTEYVAVSKMGFRNDTMYVRPTDLFDFGRSVIAKINSQITDKRMTPARLSEIIQEDTRLPVMIKNVELLGPDSTPLKTLKEEAPEVFADFKKDLEQNVLPKLEGSMTADILRYDGIVDTLKEKYGDIDKLRELSKEMNESFILGKGDFNHFMMARLYEMAAISLEQGDNFKANSEESTILKRAYAEAIQTEAKSVIESVLENPSISKTMRLQDFFIDHINDKPSKDLADKMEILNQDDYLKEFKSMANWVVKFQMKRSGLNIIPKAKVDAHDINGWEGQKRVSEHLLAKEFKEKLDRFRQQTLPRYGDSAVLRPKLDSVRQYDGNWSYVLEKF